MADPSDIIGRWIAAHPDGLLGLILDPSDIDRRPPCIVCGERFRSPHRGTRVTCPQHPPGGWPRPDLEPIGALDA